MKRSLGIIFSLMMIMTAFMGCDIFMDDEWETITLPHEPGNTTPAGTVRISQKYTGSIAKNKYYVENKIIRNHFDIRFYGEDGSYHAGNGWDIGDLKVQIKYSGETEWKDVTFGSSTYKKVGEASVRAYKPSKESLGGTTRVLIYEAPTNTSL